MSQQPNRNEEDLKRVIAALLATEGRSEDEVRTFQAKAAKLMHKLGLTREDIFAEKPDMHTAEMQITRFDWIVAQYIGSGISRLTGTQEWYTILSTPTGKRSDRKVFHFAGYRSDVDQAIWLFKHLIEASQAGARGISATSERNSYLVGFASTVYRRLTELAIALEGVQEDMAPTGNDNALVLAKKEDTVNAFLKKIVPGLRDGQSKGTTVKDYSALVAGQRDGKSVSLGRGVAQGAKALMSPGS